MSETTIALDTIAFWLPGSTYPQRAELCGLLASHCNAAYEAWREVDAPVEGLAWIHLSVAIVAAEDRDLDKALKMITQMATSFNDEDAAVGKAALDYIVSLISKVTAR